MVVMSLGENVGTNELPCTGDVERALPKGSEKVRTVSKHSDEIFFCSPFG